MIESDPPTKSEFVETGIRLDKEHDDQKPYSTKSQIQLLVANAKLYAAFLIKSPSSQSQIKQLKNKLIQQLWLVNSEGLHVNKLQNFSETYPHLELEADKISDNLHSFGEMVYSLVTLKQQTESEEEFQRTELIINGLLKEMEVILNKEKLTLSRLEKYEVYSNNIDESQLLEKDEKPTHYYPRQKITFDLDLAPEVFSWVQPSLHQRYVAEVAKVYHPIVPFKIKHIMPGNTSQVPIEMPNYFDKQIQPQKAIMHYVKPNTNILYSYRLDDICKVLTIQKQYIFERQLPIAWKFSPEVRTVITPEGRMFSINSKSNKKKIDSAMYEILEEKVSNKGRRPDPKRNCGFIYANNSLYVIAGNNDNEPCSQKNYRYSLKDKKWYEIADSNIALRKPTVCVFRDRYIMKIGGLNQFNYISKNIELYDTKTDRWSIVRASPRNIMEEVQILQDSLAAQITHDQIYIFSGKNNNNFQSDSGFVLQFNDIIERQKGPAKVTGEFWNVTVGKRSLYSFFGLFSQSNVIMHYNCLYALRVQCSKSLSF